MAQLQITMYIYASKLPAQELTMINCLRCRRTLFRTTSNKILLSNAYGASFTELPPSSSYIEHQCHSCKTLYQILFQ